MDLVEFLHLPPPRPYRDYIAWLQRQDLSEAEAYWRRTLAGFEAPTALPIGRGPSRTADSDSDYGDEQIYLSQEASQRLQSFAQRQRLTLQATPRNRTARGWNAPYIAAAEKVGLSVYTRTLSVNRPATRGEVIESLLQAFGIQTEDDLTAVGPQRRCAATHRGL